MSSTPRKPRGRSANTDEIREVFIRRVHRLLRLGYDRMKAADFQVEEEPAITGELARRIDEVCDDPQSEEWVRSFSVHDDPPVHSPGRKGKARRRADIRLDSLECPPRQRFSFEAKRLGKNNSVRAYLGPKGLGCFLRGDYARDDDIAGMLGYVQSHDPQYWADKIEAALTKSPCSDSTLATSPWRRHDMVHAGLQNTYRSGHKRAKPARPIEIYHTLLVFN